jgi:methylglutaconyl-CoA hydratase
MKKMVNYSKGENEKDSHLLFDMINAIQSCPVPTIARVNGSALGGGAGIVASCDIAIASILI